jgi:hypothetical protein
MAYAKNIATAVDTRSIVCHVQMFFCHRLWVSILLSSGHEVCSLLNPFQILSHNAYIVSITMTMFGFAIAAAGVSVGLIFSGPSIYNTEFLLDLRDLDPYVE